jgi:hypothetical protein
MSDRIARQVIQAINESRRVEQLIQLAYWIPGLREVVACPVCRYSGQVWQIIVDLTDRHHWPSERVTRWLETLPIDLEVKGATQ